MSREEELVGIVSDSEKEDLHEQRGRDGEDF
jgi:hypothetical protein